MITSKTDIILKDARGVIHIGANSGQERDIYSKYQLNVIWVEAIPSVYQELCRNIEAYHNQLALNELITDHDDKDYCFYVANNLGLSSSIYDLHLHKDVYPGVRYERQIELKSITLQTLIKRERIELDKYDILTLDTQGAELLALIGAGELVRKFRYIYLEVANFESYKNCCQLKDIEPFMAAHGFIEAERKVFSQHADGGQYFNIYYRNKELIPDSDVLTQEEATPGVDKTDIARLKQEAWDLIKDGNYMFMSAAKKMERLLPLVAEDPEILYMWARVFESQGLAEKAIENYELASKIRPNLTQAIYAQADLLRRLKRYKEVENLLFPMLNTHPSEARPDYLLGQVFSDTSRYEWACGAFETTIKKARQANNQALMGQAQKWLEDTKKKRDKPVGSSGKCLGKHLHIIHMSGLGNRLYCVLYGVYLARSLGFKPIIYWPQNSWCGCRFEDLFDERDIEIRTENKWETARRMPSAPLIRTNRQTLDENREQVVVNNYVNEKQFFRHLESLNSDCLYMCVELPPFAEQGKFYKEGMPFKFRQSIIDDVEAFALDNDIDFLATGLHIRKTDFPVDVDLDSLSKLIRNHAQKRFFVCSDDPSVEEFLTRHDNAVSLPKQHPVKRQWEAKPWGLRVGSGENTVSNIIRSGESIVEAMKDMLILSKTDIHKTTPEKQYSTFQLMAVTLKRLMNAHRRRTTMSEALMKNYSNPYFFETGTADGCGVELALKSGFEKVFSVEIKPDLYEQNVARFKKYIDQGRVILLLGDSLKLLERTLLEIDKPTTFWLDAHHDSGIQGEKRCPLYEELEAIRGHSINTHTILIDDRRMFGKWWGEGITEESIRERIKLINQDYKIVYEDGIAPDDIIAAKAKIEENRLA